MENTVYIHNFNATFSFLKGLLDEEVRYLKGTSPYVKELHLKTKMVESENHQGCV